MIKKESLTQIVGPGQVSQDAAALDAYARDMSFVNAVTPGYVVKPKDSRAIQELMKLANETQTPLIPVSSGPPHFRGDTVPSTGGAIIVDLSGMKKIIFVDRARRVAMVEPGVTFGELIPAVEKEGLLAYRFTWREMPVQLPRGGFDGCCDSTRESREK